MFCIISGAATNKEYVEDYLRSCRWQLPKKTTLVCFREGSDEIIGLNVTYVSGQNDPFWEEVTNAVIIVPWFFDIFSVIYKIYFLKAQTDEFKSHMTIAKIVRGNVDIFEKYNVDKYLGCICLSVAPAYRGLNIGQRFLEAR